MSNLTLGVDYWTLVWPRFIQGFGQGFIFVPLSTLALATVRKDRLGNATAAFKVIRNVGGSCGVALAATLLSRRSQYHQTTLVGHVNVWSVDTTARLKDWSDHFVREGGDPVHRAEPGAGDALSRYGGPGAGAGVRGRVLAALHHVLRDHPVGSADAPDSYRAARGRGSPSEARRGAQTDKSFSMMIVSTHLPSS
jgi:hypothetical protein